MTEVVVDTVVLQHCVRAGTHPHARNPLDRCVLERRLRFCVDPDLALVDEWKLTVGAELVTVLLTRWEGAGGVRVVARLPSLGSRLTRSLRQLKFRGTIDKLIVKIALVTADRLISSEDSDFWDPDDSSRPGRIGDASSPVAALLARECGITVLTLQALLVRASCAP